jgi:hypothetical protein
MGESRAFYNSVLQGVHARTYDLNNRVNWAELNYDGTNPHEGEIEPLEEYINHVFSKDGALTAEFMGSLTPQQKQQIYADYDDAFNRVQDIRRTVEEAYNNFHHGASKAVDLDEDGHDESDDNADNDVQGMGKPGSSLLERGAMYHDGLNRRYSR